MRTVATESEPCVRIAERAFERHAALYPLTHYTGILSLHGLARLARITGRADLRERARTRLLPFVQGEHGEFPCNFPNYRCGGNAAAYLLMEGDLPEAAEPVARHADRILREAPRDPDGIVCKPNDPERRRIWIDAAFAVTPFLLFAGRAHDRPDWLDEACAQTEKMMDTLRDPANGLLHQAKNFNGPGRITEDHWSRGNGWGLLALSELVAFLPDGHGRRTAIEQRFRDLVEACLRVRGPSGLWHQELTEHASYVETSGSGLILYAIGVGLERGLLPPDIRSVFETGLRALLDYMTPAGDVFHTCRGCLAPGEGRMVDYMARAPVRNDPHAFGPILLAFGQAAALGVTL